MKQSTMNNDVISSVWIVPNAQRAYSARQSREAEEYIAVWMVDSIKDEFKKQEKELSQLRARVIELEENLNLQKMMHERYRELTRSELATKEWKKDNERLRAQVEKYREALKTATIRLEILTGRMRACHEETGKHELLGEADAFCTEAREALRQGEDK